MSAEDRIFDQVQWRPIDNPAAKDVAVNDIPYQTHEGEIKLAGYIIRCVQLNTGQRLLMSEDVEKFFS